MNKKKLRILICILLLYVIMICILLYAESDDPAGYGSIKTFGDAVWYSIVTLTTVGYGDISPVTVVGRIVGVVFMLSSLGLFSTVIAFLYSLIKGDFAPGIRLWISRKKKLHVFINHSAETEQLLSNWNQCFPNDVTVLLSPGSVNTNADIVIDLNPEQLLARAGGEVDFYCFGNDGLNNLSAASKISMLGEKVYYSSDCGNFSEDQKMSCFEPVHSCARQFWMKYPLQENEHEILFIGGKKWMPALVEQALLVNIYSAEQNINYHICGDSGHFRSEHYGLNLQCDSISYHDDIPASEQLFGADRIILCMDEDEENIFTYSGIRKYFPMNGKIFMRLNSDDIVLTDVCIFGTLGELYTPELVINKHLDRAARLINDYYSRQNPENAASWDNLDEYSRGSNIAAADHLSTKLQILLNNRNITEITPEICADAAKAYVQRKERDADFFREIEHIRWCRFLFMRNWRYGNVPKKDVQRRIHPMLKPYSELSVREQQIDDNSWACIGEIFKETNGR